MNWLSFVSIESWPPDKPGMGVHKPTHGVAVYHEMTGLGVIVTSERSRQRNKARALELLSTLLSETEHPQ